MLTDGRLEKSGEDLELCVRELVHDLNDWPSGHIVIRQRESDTLLEAMRATEGRKPTTQYRKQRLELRDALRRRTTTEKAAYRGLDLLLRDPDISMWTLQLWDEQLPFTIEAYLNHQLYPRSERPDFSGQYLRMSPAGDPERRCSEKLSKADLAVIQDIMKERTHRYGQPLTDTVSELPAMVRAVVAIPRLIRGLLEYVDEDRLTWDQLRHMKALDLPSWTVSIG